MLADLLQALLERSSLCLTDVARALPVGPQGGPGQPLHSRFNRLERFLSNPHLDEAALFVRWLRLSLRFGAEIPLPPAAPPLLPLLLDTTYFDPFAALIVSVPCGGRGLPVAFTTYHRQTLEACFPPQDIWPTYDTTVCSPRPRKGQPVVPASAQVAACDSQNLIEEHLLDYLWSFLTPGLQAVIVADRGFARASLFRLLLGQGRAFVIRFDATTTLTLPDGTSGPTRAVLPLTPGERRGLPQAFYGAEDPVPVAVQGVWDPGQEEPWYLATALTDGGQTETLYRWRMRIEAGNRDEKTGVILREGGDQHRLTTVLHLHRLLLAVFCLQWLAALTGLQAQHDLPLDDGGTAGTPTPIPSGLDGAPPTWEPTGDLLGQGPGQPPAVVPHRGPTLDRPAWMRAFAIRGPLSYVRLGMEILRAKGLLHIAHRVARWLGIYFWSITPLWSPRQVRYRLRRWWPLPV